MSNVYENTVKSILCFSCKVFYTVYEKSLSLDWSKLKAFAGEKLYIAEEVKFLGEGQKTSLGEKEENPSPQHFLLFPQCFQKASS